MTESTYTLRNQFFGLLTLRVSIRNYKTQRNRSITKIFVQSLQIKTNFATTKARAEQFGQAPKANRIKRFGRPRFLTEQHLSSIFCDKTTLHSSMRENQRLQN